MSRKGPKRTSKRTVELLLQGAVTVGAGVVVKAAAEGLTGVVADLTAEELVRLLIWLELPIGLVLILAAASMKVAIREKVALACIGALNTSYYAMLLVLIPQSGHFTLGGLFTLCECLYLGMAVAYLNLAPAPYRGRALSSSALVVALVLGGLAVITDTDASQHVGVRIAISAFGAASVVTSWFALRDRLHWGASAAFLIYASLLVARPVLWQAEPPIAFLIIYYSGMAAKVGVLGIGMSSPRRAKQKSKKVIVDDVEERNRWFPRVIPARAFAAERAAYGETFRAVHR